MARNGRRDNKTGSIYKDGDGYRAKVAVGIDPASGRTRFRKVRTATHKEAVEALQRLQVSQHAQTLVAPQGITLADFVEHWLEASIKPNRAPKTYTSYAFALRNHVIPTLGRKKLDAITRQDVQALVQALSRQKVQPRSKASPTPTATLSPRTIQMVRTVLGAVFQGALRDGLVAKNPCHDIQLPTRNKKAPVFLHPEQAVALSQAVLSSDLAELFQFLISTGTRLGEATGVRWVDIDLDKGLVRICGQLQRIDGVLTYRPKTKTNQDRTLPMGPTMTAALIAMRVRHEDMGWEDADGLAFLNVYGRRLDPKFVSDRLAKACLEAGVPVVSPHKLRHTAATLMLAETGDLHAVQKVLGHQQVALTADLYGHATIRSLQKVASVMDRVLQGQPPL